MMYGHLEEPRHWVAHLDLLRAIQRETGGFTEFVPLSFVHQEAPMYRLMDGVRAGATGAEVLRMHALARLYLGPTFRNIQASWVKEGPRLAQILLEAGCNDLGGTLINESISTSAGAAFGQLVPPRELRRLILDLGRVPAQRTTTYRLLDEQELPLDRAEDGDFGSYQELVASGQHRFIHPHKNL
jgi:FO synthase subunit 2